MINPSLVPAATRQHVVAASADEELSEVLDTEHEAATQVPGGIHIADARRHGRVGSLQPPHLRGARVHGARARKPPRLLRSTTRPCTASPRSWTVAHSGEVAATPRSSGVGCARRIDLSVRLTEPTSAANRVSALTNRTSRGGQCIVDLARRWSVAAGVQARATSRSSTSPEPHDTRVTSRKPASRSHARYSPSA